MTLHAKIVKMMGAPNCEFDRRVVRDDRSTPRVRRVIECPPTAGWLVGVRVVSSEWSVNYCPSDYTDALDSFAYHSDQKPRITVALVAPWPNKPPIEVPAEAVYPVGTFGKESGGLKPQNPREYDTQEQRKNYREHPEWYPRDARGRFVKGGV